jgi:Uma2 family endonuclease
LIIVRIHARLTRYLELNPIGQVRTPDQGIPLTRPPDLAFTKTERVGVPNAVPDMVVDVLIPGPRPIQILSRITDWLRAGVQAVWVFEPQRNVARVYRCDGTEEVIAQGGSIVGETILPGFTCPLPEVFPPP